MTDSDSNQTSEPHSPSDGSTSITEEQEADTDALPDGTGSESSILDEGDSDYASGGDPE